MTYRQALANNQASIRAMKDAILRDERKRAERKAKVANIATAFAFASFGAMVLGVIGLSLI